MRIKLSDERKAEIVRALIGHFSTEFDEKLSEYRAEGLVDFLLHQIGPSQYNQAIADARNFMSDKLADLDTDFYEPEDN